MATDNVQHNTTNSSHFDPRLREAQLGQHTGTLSAVTCPMVHVASAAAHGEAVQALPASAAVINSQFEPSIGVPCEVTQASEPILDTDMDISATATAAPDVPNDVLVMALKAAAAKPHKHKRSRASKARVRVAKPAVISLRQKLQNRTSKSDMPDAKQNVSTNADRA